MELGFKVYDILKLKSCGEDCFDTKLPMWATEFVERTPYVVVKRGEEKTGMVPIGIRGITRQQRFGCYMNLDNISQVYKPYELLEFKSNCGLWNKVASLLPGIFETYKDRVTYGPTGSVGFELATGFKATTISSDLDLLIQTEEPLEVEIAKKILVQLLKINIKMDITLGISMGYVALEEYCNGQAPYLVKTNYGERLVERFY